MSDNAAISGSNASPSAISRGDVSGLARRSALSLFGAAVSAVVNFLIIVVVTRGVDKDDAGILFSATALFLVIQGLCMLGTETGLVYFIARVRALNQHQSVKTLLRFAGGPIVIASSGAALVLLLSAPVLTRWLFPGESGPATTALRLLALFLPLAVVYKAGIAATQAFHTMKATVYLEKIGRPVGQIALLLVVVATGTSWALPLAWAAPYSFCLLLVISSVHRLVRNDQNNRGGGSGSVPRRDFWGYTWPRSLAATAQLALQRLDIVLVAAYLGAAPAAVYTAATRFVVLGQLGSQAIALATKPKLSALLARNAVESVQHVYQVSTAWIIAVTWPVHILAAILAPLLLLLFGHGYNDGNWVVVVLAAAMLVATGCGMVTTVLVMAGRTSWNLTNVSVALGVNLALNVLLIPRVGIIGAAVAWATAIVLSNVLPLIQIHHLLGLHPFGRAAGRVAALALACIGGCAGTGWALAEGRLWVVFLTVGAGIGLYAAGLWRMLQLLEWDGMWSRFAKTLPSA